MRDGEAPSISGGETGCEDKSLAVIRSVIRGVGAYLPKRRMTNDDLSKIVDTTDEWIVERTGIR